MLLSATTNPLAGSPGWVLGAAGLPWATPCASTLIKGALVRRLPREGALQPGFPPGTDGTQRGWRPGAGAGEKNQRDVGTVLGPSGERSPLATDSPSKWRQSYSPSREWLANVPIPSFILVCLHLLHLMYEWSRGGEQWDEEGGRRKDDVVEERQAISVCPLKLVLWLFSVRSLSRDTQGIWLWKASALSQSEAEFKHPAWKVSADSKHLTA